MVRKLFLGFMLISVVLLNGCMIQPVQAPADGNADSDGTVSSAPSGITASGESIASILEPLDPIYIRFSGVVDQQTLEMFLDENGEISLLHIKEPIQASGLTPSALENKIERLYIDGGIYKNITVNVTMTSMIYYVQGEVLAPGQFQLMSGTTLLQAIAGARGYSPYANKRKVTITRHGKIYTFDAKQIEKNPSKDVKIEAGDVIKVWQQWY